MRTSYAVLGACNLLTMILGLPILIIGIWLTTTSDSECLQFLQQPTIVIGATILVVSAIGLLGFWTRVGWIVMAFLYLLLLLIVLLLVFTVFTYMVTSQGTSHPVPHASFVEYRIQDFSGWLQHQVDGRNWRKIKSCLRASDVCGVMADYSEPEVFMNASLTPLQSGCCKPPMSCGFIFRNATFWDKPETEPFSFVSREPDCAAWSNNQEQLCLDCSSCKAGLLANIRRDWHRVALVDLVVLCFLVVVYSASSWAYVVERHRYRDGFTCPCWGNSL